MSEYSAAQSARAWIPAFLLIVTSLAPAQPATAPASVKDVVAPVRVGEPPSNEAVIVTLPDNSLRIFYILRPAGTELRSIESTDGGLTWGNDRLEFELPGVAYYAIQVAVDHAGELQAIFHILGQGENGRNGRHYNVWHNSTSEGRGKWGSPKLLYEGYVGSLRGFTVLKTGRLVLSVSVAVPARGKAVAGEPDYGWNDVIVFYSDDRGATWQRSPDRLMVLQDEKRGRTRYGAVEPHVVELLDGRVWMLIRTKNGFFYESFSPDGGAHWPQPKPSKLISSDSPAATARLKDGRLVLFLNACQSWDDLRSYAIGGREVLHAAISRDDGKTWGGFREVLHDPRGEGKGDRGTAYPTAAVSADGKIVFVSGQGEQRRATLMLDPAWLEETKRSDDFAAGDAQWTMYESKGAGIVDHPDRQGAKALAIRKTEPGAQSGAVWNFPMGAGGKLVLNVLPKEGHKGLIVSLTDHFSVVADKLADENAVYSMRIAPDDPAYAKGTWHEVTIEWQPAGDATVSVDGSPAKPLKRMRAPAFGVNYLRLRSAAADADEAGVVIDRVAVEVMTPAGGSARANDLEDRSQAARTTAPSAGQIDFEKVRGPETGGAALDNGPASAFDHGWTTCPTVLHDGQRYRMWYSSFYTSREGQGGIGMAQSDDGVRWSRLNDGKPVLGLGPEGAFDARQVMGPDVHFDGELYRMWYTGQSDREHPSKIVTYQIGLATSQDGIRWMRANEGKPVIECGPAGTPDEVQAATPCILREGDHWRMWYAAWAPSSNHTICVARSGDGIRWERENDGKPVEGLSPSIAYGHAIARAGERYVMLYMALKATRGLYGATSADGIHWRMLNSGQPVISPGSQGDFDSDIVGQPCLLTADGILRAWYTGYQIEPGGVANWRLRIGLAQAKLAL